MGLQDELNAMLEQSKKMIPDEVGRIMDNAMKELLLSNITDHSKRKGDLAPVFELSNATGETISSKTLLANGPIVINFYRGAW